VSADGDPLLDRAGLSADELAQVLDLVSGSDIAELDVTIGLTRLTLRRPPTLSLSTDEADVPAPTVEPLSLAITSPLVGIFRPSVTTGELVQPGQAIGAIEALGMPTSVDAPQSGTVEELLVPDGSAVEYGQALLILRRAPHAS
jgi:biotin carboxyl carrier protein